MEYQYSGFISKNAQSTLQYQNKELQLLETALC